jgi:DHA3 family macrolide efflux protein-like MFS transporter
MGSDKEIPVMTDAADHENSKKWMAPFFTIWIGQAFSLLGSQLVQFALVWWLTQKFGSATVLAKATLVALLPQVLLGPIAGTLVDRWNRRVVMIVADTMVALATLLLAVLFYFGKVQVWHIYLLMLIRSLGGGFHWPAMQASTSLMMPKEHLSRVQGLNQMLGGAMSIGAAPLAALLIGIMPMPGIMMIDIGTALLAILPLLFIPIPQPTRSASPEALSGKTSVWQELRAGLHYVWGWPGLMLVLVAATLINLVLTPAGSLQPILVTKHFGGQALQFAWMESAWGLGVVVGGLTLSTWGGFRRRVLTSLAGLIVMGFSTTAIGIVPASGFWVAVAMIFIMGFTNPIVNGPLFAVVQAVVAPDMQGRVFTLMMSAAGAMTPLSLLIAGPVADATGVQTWYLVGGLLTILIGIVSFFIPAIMHLEEGRKVAGENTGAQQDSSLPVPAVSSKEADP